MEKKILIADDHHVVRVGTYIILKDAFADLSFDFASNFDEVKEKVAMKNIDLVILDIEMPGSKYKSMVTELKKLCEDILILIFSSHEESIALQYYNEGAHGFLNKLSEPEDLIAAVQSIFNKGFYYSSAIMGDILEDRKYSPVHALSHRELEVFNLLAKGYGNLEIANSLGIGETTAATHKRRIYLKLHIKNVADLIKIYNSIH
ncbi:response regulator [Chryseobacterium sp. 2R14A]|uniref:response regulator transcription factor n=1 Tax=Chryseobacterium sp. 2R14A TaxID=3380353 RepID=UPI003CE9A1AE